MINNQKLCSIALVSIAMVLMLINLAGAATFAPTDLTDYTSGGTIKNSITILGNIFYPGIGWQATDTFYPSIAKELNATVVNSYLDTGITDGAFQVYLAWEFGDKPVIATETNFLSNNSDSGEYNIAFAHSGGTRTLIDKIETGTIKANYVVLAAPALITQNELENLIARYGVKKVIVFQSSRDILNLLQVTLERNHRFADNSVGPAIIGYGIPKNLTPHLMQAHLSLDVIPPRQTFWIGGSDRDRASLFTTNGNVIQIYADPKCILELPWSMHHELCKYMADYYASSQYPFNGAIPGLKGLS